MYYIYNKYNIIYILIFNKNISDWDEVKVRIYEAWKYNIIYVHNHHSRQIISKAPWQRSGSSQGVEYYGIQTFWIVAKKFKDPDESEYFMYTSIQVLGFRSQSEIWILYIMYYMSMCGIYSGILVPEWILEPRPVLLVRCCECEIVELQEQLPKANHQ